MKQPEPAAAAELAPGAGDDQASSLSRNREVKRGISILDIMARFLAAAGTLGSAIAMGTTDETVTVAAFSQVLQFNTKFNDLPAFTFFVVANSVVGGYLVLSFPVSVFHIISSSAKTSRIVMVSLDTVMLSILTAGASSAAAMVYLAHKGNANANWSAICQQFDDFCHRISGSLVGSFVAILLFIIMVVASSVSLSRH
ncbi:Casparian strip membrane protein 6 [Linum grandiflorum]